ncbi:hypothetical protein AB7M56_000369 [Bradyrhizobium elkanii]|uniref:Uncharacterized protein n=1 Tax=Bradyrhizobium elkanii TaxID=29448 RepID=A0ABV4FCP1_BRAEL|nr:hypothetical protein [Bradyrhizobium elkanii]MCS3717032.1 hypothetical protein [Bradyrhizobium elkanii]MCS3886885.1 hypothetical protein [Bradyrhizobium elkanii]MCS4214095.1 hypothetical protein [Bradyrhizobium elkanii]MCW2214400.1 hypothetical protein [Bradyrhizobium elkanii]
MWFTVEKEGKHVLYDRSSLSKTSDSKHESIKHGSVRRE